MIVMMMIIVMMMMIMVKMMMIMIMVMMIMMMMMTIVQKTHDADPDLVTEFGGRGVLILRNPYDAILSKFHYLYGGHHGLASEEHFSRLTECDFET